MSRIVVHIERLSLKGIAAGDRQAVAEALQAELTRQLRDPRVVQSLVARGDINYRRLESLHLAPETSAGQLGCRAAEAVVGSSGRPGGQPGRRGDRG